MKNKALAFLPFLLAGFTYTNDSHSSSAFKTTFEIQQDGPYVIYRKKNVVVKYIVGNDGIDKVQSDSMPISKKKELTLNVSTDVPEKKFIVQLKDKLEVERYEYSKAEKLLVISDIEGNFGAFRKLLQHSAVIDSNFNWTFGNGHLVLIGDFFDRGNQVSEVLWLIYSLEDKAKAAGGYVHFILGNHEIMNMSGDLRYLNNKYVQNTILLKEKYADGMYGSFSELGRWLRTKNIVEKIGSILFMHGGISPEINRMDISLHQLNDLTRPHYSDSTNTYKNKNLDIIFSELGPFWYRGYYIPKDGNITAQIDSTLKKFDVKQIATGHTIVGDTISIFQKGKLINVDVHHASGRSEALLIDGNKYYRINGLGVKKMLM
jgi:hypothetical protein